MGALCKQAFFPLGALEAEAKAAEAGILLAWDLGLKNIVVEGDAQLVTQALKGIVVPAIPIQKIVEVVRTPHDGTSVEIIFIIMTPGSCI